MNTATSQTDAILRRLQRARGKWVSVSQLHDASGSLSPATRISNLRERNYRIENRTETAVKNGIRRTRSFYRLLP